MREETFKRHLVRRVNPQPAMDLLDLVCGTGTLTLMLKRALFTALAFCRIHMHSLEEAADNFAGLIPQFITETCFHSVEELEHFLTKFGPLSLWSPSKG